MFKNVEQMGEVSQLLFENNISYYEMYPTKIIFHYEDDFERASSILEDYDVELVLNDGALAKTSVSESREVMKTTVGLRDLIDIIKWW